MPAFFESGFSVREPMWHGQGYVPDRYPETWEQAREWAGLTWEPEARPVFAFHGDLEEATARLTAAAEGDSNDDEIEVLHEIVASFGEIPGRQQIVRSDTGATLGITTTDYTIISHQEMGEVVEALLGFTNVKYETTIVMHEGRQIAVLAYLDEPITLPGDKSLTFPFLAVTTRHDGGGSLKALPTTVRIVCANTCSAAEAEGDRYGTAFTFGHSKGWRDRLEEAKQTIAGLRTDFDKYVELMSDLAAVKVTREQTEQFVTAFIPSPPEGLVSDRVSRNVEEARDAVRLILNSPTAEGVGGTAAGLVHAATEYLDHYRRYRSLDSYYTRQLLRPEPLKAKAVSLVREIAKV